MAGSERETESIRLIGILVDIAEVAGEDAARALARRFGGSEIYIPYPSSIGGSHPLAECVGQEAARTIADRLGRGHVKVPMGRISGRGSLPPHIFAIIANAHREGIGTSRIARIVGCSVSTVERHLRRACASG